MYLLNGRLRGLLSTSSIQSRRDTATQKLLFLLPPPRSGSGGGRNSLSGSPPVDSRPFPVRVRTGVVQAPETQAWQLPSDLEHHHPTLRKNTPFGGHDSATKGRALFTITLCLRSEFPSLGGPQKGTRNSLIPGRLPPSGGHFSAKREAPAASTMGGAGAGS